MLLGLLPSKEMEGSHSPHLLQKFPRMHLKQLEGNLVIKSCRNILYLMYSFTLKDFNFVLLPCCGTLEMFSV